MEERILQMLQDVGYSGPLLDAEKLSQAFKLGARSTDYTGLVAWLAEQLTKFMDIEETIHATTSADDASSFLLELSFFLKEIGCVNEKLMAGNVNQRLANESERATLIEFLLTELMAGILLEAKRPEQMKDCLDESDTAKNLRSMLVTLGMVPPPDRIASDVFFKAIRNAISQLGNKYPLSQVLGEPLINVELSAKQWEKLSQLQEDLHKEYTLRREMLLKRLDVTVQSFLWSDRIKSQEDEVNVRYDENRKALKSEPEVMMADLLTARNDLMLIEKTSNASVRKNTRSKINSVIIGAVPDRGGRPHEQEPPPPEMPPWQKDRVAGPPSFRGGRGGGRGGGGSERGRGGGDRGHRGGRGGGGGYRDHKDATSNFGQNLNYQQPQYSGHGHRECHADYRDGSGYQRGGGGGSGNESYRGDSSANYGQSYNQNYGQNYSQSYGQSYDQQPHYSGQRDSYGGDNRGGGSYYNEKKEGGGGGGRGGRVQGGWNQGTNNSGTNSYKRGGYNRGRGRQYY